MVASISDEQAQEFAEALIRHAGNRSQAAIECGYAAGNRARSAGSDLSRNPKVLKVLQPMVLQHLSALTPRAVQTLSKLLDNKSGYIRLEAAKDILNRNGVGMSTEPLRAQPLVVRINLAVGNSADAPQVIEHKDLVPLNPDDRPGGRKSEEERSTRSLTHDFFPKVTADKVSSVLNLEDEDTSIPSKSFELDLD